MTCNPKRQRGRALQTTMIPNVATLARAWVELKEPSIPRSGDRGYLELKFREAFALADASGYLERSLP